LTNRDGNHVMRQLVQELRKSLFDADTVPPKEFTHLLPYLVVA
jgi:hypothetical protein